MFDKVTKISENLPIFWPFVYVIEGLQKLPPRQKSVNCSINCKDFCNLLSFPEIFSLDEILGQKCTLAVLKIIHTVFLSFQITEIQSIEFATGYH